jgi:bifunctional non-homologous end joining protein LigD
VDASGKPSFQALQQSGRRRAAGTILYFAFDLLNFEGKALLGLPLIDRKALLERLLAGAPAKLRFVPFLDGTPDDIITGVSAQELEGIVAKRADSRYEPGKRSGAWVKFKCGFAQEFVIGGYTRGRGANAQLGALIVGYYEGGKLVYASKVGTGFTASQIRSFVENTVALQQAEPPFHRVPIGEPSSWNYCLTASEIKSAVWLKPLLVCRVRFTEWTRDGHLRHPLFGGLRTDKDAENVKREPGG